MENLVEELRWRGLVHDIMPGTEEQLLKEMTTGYVGFDPTADSLHIGSLVPIMLLVHLQRYGHKPVALVGGATGMVGDPSGKSEERNLLDEATLNHNLKCVENQLRQFLDFDATKPNAAVMANNFDWFKNFSFLDFIRDAGKHITVNYMLAKDSVKNRLENGMSFTEFSYQLVQGYDFYHLNTQMNCKLQMGGSDQWGNIVTGTELIRRKGGTDAFAITAPLVKKADGGKFGKTESGNVWLDRNKTSPFKFYQFWLNVSDEDAKTYIRVFSLLDKATIESLEKEHDTAPHERMLQKALAKDITIRVHSEEDYEAAVDASQILYKKGQDGIDALKGVSEELFNDLFDGVPQAEIAANELSGMGVVDLIGNRSGFLASNGEARRALKSNAISINKEKVDEDKVIASNDLIGGKYLLLQHGKKNQFIIKAV